MSEQEVLPGEGPSAGTLLRQAREAAGLHVATLAANLKVPVRKLEALEEDRYEELPDAVFVRALASSVCRTLKMDPAPVLQRLPHTPQPRLAQMTQSINAPFRTPGDGPHPGFVDQLSRPVVLTVVLLLLGALVLVFLPWVQRGYETVVQANRSETAITPAAPADNGSVPPAAPLPSEQAAAPAAAPAPAPTAAAPAPAAPATPAAPSAAPPPATAQSGDAGGMQLRTSTTAAPAAAAASAIGGETAQGIVVFRTRGESWVQVKDARGTTVMQRLMAKGEVAGASGTLPLSVTVGSVQSTDVQVRGKPFDLAPLSRDNVARFEVK